MNRDKEKIKQDHYFTIRIAGMPLVDVSANGYYLNKMVSDGPINTNAEVTNLILGADGGKRNPYRVYQVRAVEKILEVIEPGVKVEITEHLIETYEETTTVDRSAAEFSGKHVPQPVGITKDGGH